MTKKNFLTTGLNTEKTDTFKATTLHNAIQSAKQPPRPKSHGLGITLFSKTANRSFQTHSC